MLLIKKVSNNWVVYIVGLTLFVYALNLGEVLNIDRFNPVAKSLWFLLAIILLLKKRVKKYFILYFLAFVFICHFLLIGVDHSLFSYKNMLMSMTQVFILYAILSASFFRKEVVNILKLFCFYPLFIVIVGYSYQLMGVSELFLYEHATGLMRLSGTMSSAFLAGWCIAAIYSAIKLTQIENSKINYIMILVNFVILYLTAARMPIFIAGIVSFSLFFFSMPKFSFNTKFRVIVTFFPLALAILPIVLQQYLIREQFSGDSGRELMWSYFVHIYEVEYHTWGAGFGHQYRIIPESLAKLTNTVAVHNEYIRLSVELGFWGAVTFLFLTLSFAYKVYLDSKSIYKYEYALVFSLFMLYSYFDNTITSPSVFSFLFCCFLINNSSHDYSELKSISNEKTSY